jgi:hypothetical protein
MQGFGVAASGVHKGTCKDVGTCPARAIAAEDLKTI